MHDSGCFVSQLRQASAATTAATSVTRALTRCRHSYFLKGEIGAVSPPRRDDEALQALINVCSGLSVLSWTNINMLRLRACLGAGG